MKNYNKITLILLSTFYITSLFAVQQETLESLVIDRLNKINTLVNEINKTKIASLLYKEANGQYRFGGGSLDNLNNLTIYLREVTDSLNRSDKKTRDQIILQLKKQPNNPLFKRYISLLTNNQDNFFIPTGTPGMSLEYELERVILHYRASGTNIIKQDVINYIKDVLTKLGYDASEFIELNK